MTNEKSQKQCDDFFDEEKWEKKFEKKFENWGKCDQKWHNHVGDGMSGWIYCLGLFASAVYYIQQSTGFWMGVLGVLKAIVWPAMLIYEVFVRLNM